MKDYHIEIERLAQQVKRNKRTIIQLVKIIGATNRKMKELEQEKFEHIY